MVETITMIKKIIVMLVAVIGVVIAYLGLRTWNAQLKGTTKYKIAKDILIKTFKLRDEFDRARSPLMTAAELLHASSGGEESIEILSFKADVERLNKLNDVKQELEVVKLEADAVFGKDETKNVEELIRKVYEMNHNFKLMQEMKSRNDLSQKARGILFGAGSKQDTFGKNIVELVNKIEERFRKYLK